MCKTKPNQIFPVGFWCLSIIRPFIMVFCIASSRTRPSHCVLDSDYLLCAHWALPYYSHVQSQVSQACTCHLLHLNNKNSTVTIRILILADHLTRKYTIMSSAPYTLCRYLVKKIWPNIPTPDSKFHGLFTVYGGEFQVRTPWLQYMAFLLFWAGNTIK